MIEEPKRIYFVTEEQTKSPSWPCYPGWYHVDESYSHLYGPFATEADANEALNNYIKELG